jgi:hypothetical protein
MLLEGANTADGFDNPGEHGWDYKPLSPGAGR